MPSNLDNNVGKIAGLIYSRIADIIACQPLPLVPALTFKVRKVLESVTDLTRMQPHQRIELAKDVRIAIVPMLFSYELEAEVIEKITPCIESAALEALEDSKGGDSL